MLPTAAVSGWYFSHPQAHYFGVGKIERDQVMSYAQRKGITLPQAERWLAPNLGYDSGCGRRGGRGVRSRFWWSPAAPYKYLNYLVGAKGPRQMRHESAIIRRP